VVPGVSSACPRLVGLAALAEHYECGAQFAAGVDAELGNTLRRCHSTVRTLMNSWAPISELGRPSRASRAMKASCAVSVLLGHVRQQAQHAQPDQEPGPPLARRPRRRRSAPHHAVAPESAGDDPASARTVDANPRTPAPSPTARPRHAPPGTRSPTPARPGTPAARSCPSPGHRASSASGYDRPAPPRPACRAHGARHAGPSVPVPPAVASRSRPLPGIIELAAASPGTPQLHRCPDRSVTFCRPLVSPVFTRANTSVLHGLDGPVGPGL
jgi:hypothetical protein